LVTRGADLSTPSAYDFLRHRINLHRNVVYAAGRFNVGTLKTGENRTVVVPAFVIEALAASCEGKGRDDLIWAAPMKGGYLRAPAQYYSWLQCAVRRCQQADPDFPRVTPHVLRHTAASLAVQAGAHIKAIQRMLGHASAAMTLDVYADLFESDLDTVAESMARMWSQQAEPSLLEKRAQNVPTAGRQRRYLPR
jgi:integrase